MATAVALCALLSPMAEAASRPCEPVEPGGRIAVDLSDIPLRRAARLVSCATSMNLLFRPPDLGDRTVTFVSPRPVKVEILRPLFRALLAREGLRLERRGGYHVVVAEDG